MMVDELLSVYAMNIDYTKMYSNKKFDFVEVSIDTPLPVVRIYGSTEYGQKICVNIHGAFPYFYFRPHDMSIFSTFEIVESCLFELKEKLEKKLNSKLKKIYDEQINNSNKQYMDKTYIHKLEVVMSKTMYGYFESDVPFIKVIMFCPLNIKILIELIEDGELDYDMQIFEGHISFLLQVTLDYDIPNMGWLKIQKDGPKFRQPLPPDTPLFPPPPHPQLIHVDKESLFNNDSNSIVNNDIISISSSNENDDNNGDNTKRIKQFTQSSTPKALQWGKIIDTQKEMINNNNDTECADDIVKSLIEGNFTFTQSQNDPISSFQLQKSTTCELEIDIHVSHIINGHKQQINGKKIKTFGSELWEEEILRRRSKGLEDDFFTTPPYTDTLHRRIEEDGIEKDFKLRVNNLYNNGNEREKKRKEECIPNNISHAEQDKQLLSQITQLNPVYRHTDFNNNNNNNNSNNNNDDSNFENGLNNSDSEEENEKEEKEDQKSIELYTQLSNNMIDDHNDQNKNNKRKESVLSVLFRDIPYTPCPKKNKQIKIKINNNYNNNEIDNKTPEEPIKTGYEETPIKEGEFHIFMNANSPISNKPNKSFNPPSMKNLKSLKEFGLQENQNLRLHSSNAIKDALNNTSLNNSVLNRNENYKKHNCVIKTFDGGRSINYIGMKEKITTGSLGKLYQHIIPKNHQVDGISNRIRVLAPTFEPPKPSLIHMLSSENKNELISNIKKNNNNKNMTTQINTPTPTHSNAGSDQLAVNKGNITVPSELQARVTILSLELFCITRLAFDPNPKLDPIQMISWAVDDSMSNSETVRSQRKYGIIYVLQYPKKELESNINFDLKKMKFEQLKILKSSGIHKDTDIEIVDNEESLFHKIIELIRIMDPDILIGYEIQNSSFGYLINRGKNEYNIEMVQELSRLPLENNSFKNDHDVYGIEHESGIHIKGRTILNLWRRMKIELKLYNYTIQTVALELLNRRISKFSFEQLTNWFNNGTLRNRTVENFHNLSCLNLLLLDKLDLVRIAAESARLYGIDFFSVLTRGSQYRVEAAMIKKAHSLGYLACSPNKKQVANQAPITKLAFLMEPKSDFYIDPVVVLDFQSLYPSMIIAYNLCYSTIMGKVNPDKSGDNTTKKLGVIDYPEKNSESAIYNHIENKKSDPYISPCGSIFCKKEVRHGILPQMLKEIIDTRLMVKRAMKTHSGDDCALLRRSLDARQLAIKLLANVTYGYTSASFSGRMPMAELADAIVQSGRSTLEDTIKYIEQNKSRWFNAELVYGDTDSVFLLLRGATKNDAFRVGREIAHEITARNPLDVVLKFEKVYMGCLLVSKKRYVGNMFETEDQEKSHFDAKGIETVRRDQCQVVAKLQEKCIRILFESRNLDDVKSYFCSQLQKIVQGGDKLIVSDYIFSKEVKDLTKYSNIPNGGQVVQYEKAINPSYNPPHKWRVPYVVVCKSIKSALKENVVSPEVLLRRNSGLRINTTYYIERHIIPSLSRVFNLCSKNIIETWYKEMIKPKPSIRYMPYPNPEKTKNNQKQNLISNFFQKETCGICGKGESDPVCEKCQQEISIPYIILQTQIKEITKKNLILESICKNCSKFSQPSDMFVANELIGKNSCISINCSVFYERLRAIIKLEDATYAFNSLDKTNSLDKINSIEYNNEYVKYDW